MPVLRTFTFLLLATLLTSAPAVAQSPADPAPTALEALTNLLAPDYFESQLIAVSNRTDLAEDVRASALQLFSRSIALRRELADLAVEATQLAGTVDSASNKLFQANEALRAPTPFAEPDVSEKTSAQTVKQKISEVQAELQLAEAERSRLESEPKRRADRKIKIAELISEYRSAYNDLEKPGAVTSEQAIPAEFTDEVDDYSLLQKAVYLRRIRNLNLELASYDATSNLLLAQQAIATRRAAFLTDQLTLLKQVASKQRSVESANAAKDAELAQQRAEALQLPVVTSLARANQTLAKMRVALSAQLGQASAKLDEIEAESKEVVRSFNSVREQVQAVQEIGLPHSHAIGMALRQERYSLPSRKRQETEIQQRREQLANTQLEWLRVSKEQRQSADLEQRLVSIRGSLPSGMPARQQEEAIAECQRLLEEQRTLLGDVSNDLTSLRETLTKLSLAEQQFLNTINEFHEYISERVLWIQSTDRLSMAGMRMEVATTRRVLGAELRDGLIPYLKGDIAKHRYTYTCALLILLALLAARLPLSRGLAMTCPDNQPEGRLSLRPAALSLLFTAILMIPLPALLTFLGWRLQGHTSGSELADQWSHACYFTGSGLLVLEFMRQACRRPGLAVAHLRWPVHNVRLIRFHFTWVIIVAIPLGILSDTLEGVFVEGLSNRLLFITGQCLILLLGHWVLRPKRGLRFNIQNADGSREGPLKLQRIYHLLAVGIPSSLILLSALGYTYTARHIWLRVGDSIQWGMVVLVMTLLMLHWLTVMRRRLAVKKAVLRKSLEDDKDAQEQAGPDIWQVYTASRRLFSTLLWIIMAIGLWFIWSDMLPALKQLDRTPMPFFSRSAIVQADIIPNLNPMASAPVEERSGAPSEGADLVQTVPFESQDFVSIADVVTALIVILLTVAAGRNLPGFVEMVLLSRVRFRQGEGYAIVTILRYGVLLVGVGWSLTLIGITWNKVQWLAAAVTVGIGFGLQEIFANFVSGLILLFERPVRVGDVIAVGNVTGTVTRIQMRATTIRNWDQQELVVPNKDLITGQVINWTLSNDVSRLALTIGVSYDADVQLASQLLLKIAKETPNVREDPAPFVTFDEFADSTLNLILRAYVSIEVRQSTKSALNNAILEQFREAGIEIAYPQRDLHLRSVADGLPGLHAPGNTQAPPAS